MTAYQSKVKAFRDCLLNTCVRYARTTYPELTLVNCLDNEDFVEHARQWMNMPMFTRPVENAMEQARVDLIDELDQVILNYQN